MKISAAELDVMSVLWQTPGLAASDVHDALGDEKDWTSRTVKTLLARNAIPLPRNTPCRRSRRPR